uniref:Uncharacterized protein n=1 Tax=Cacopsylla melanoneura TaxID=428564 RepID=A0A8D8QL90_9HEMI
MSWPLPCPVYPPNTPSTMPLGTSSNKTTINLVNATPKRPYTVPGPARQPSVIIVITTWQNTAIRNRVNMNPGSVKNQRRDPRQHQPERVRNPRVKVQLRS